jgi:hypothetical protein
MADRFTRTSNELAGHGSRTWESRSIVEGNCGQFVEEIVVGMCAIYCRLRSVFRVAVVGGLSAPAAFCGPFRSKSSKTDVGASIQFAEAEETKTKSVESEIKQSPKVYSFCD